MQTKQVDREDTVTISRIEYERLSFLDQQVAFLNEQLCKLRRLIYGVKSERFIPIDSAQGSLFDTSEEQQEADQLSSSEKITYERNIKKKEKQQPVRALLPAHLPREEEVIEPEGLEEGMKKIGEEVTEVLEHTPGRLYVRRIVRPKYVKGKEDGVHIGQLPSLPIPKGNAGPSLLAHIMVSKFVDHLPYYRQIQIFKREGVVLSDSTFNSWFNTTARLVEPLYDSLVKVVQNQGYLQADESPIKVQDGHKERATHLGYHWVYHAPREKLAVFDYQPSRSKQGPKAFLQNFKGYLQTDGYAAYNELGRGDDIVLLGCMAHARRYFQKALDNDKERASYALKLIQSLYAIERQAKEDSELDILTLRKEKALPILKKWKQWLDQQQSQVLPKSSIGKAVNYSLNLWDRLMVYTENADFHIDNNLIENTIRPLTIGRKNYLFAGSHQAAQKAAMFYSFFACCKLHHVNPHLWLKNVLETIQDHSIKQIESLLPHLWKPKT